MQKKKQVGGKIIVLEKLIDRQSGTEEMQVQVVLLREVGVIH